MPSKKHSKKRSKKHSKKHPKKGAAKQINEELLLEAWYGVKVPSRPPWKTWYVTHPGLQALRESVAPALKKLNIFFIIMPHPLPASRDAYWADLQFDYARRINPHLYDSPYIIGSLHLDTAGKIITEPCIWFSHHMLGAKLKPKVHEIFRDALGAHYKWNGKQNRAIFVDITHCVS